MDVPEAELSQHNGQLSGSEITFRAVAIRIKSEVNKQKTVSYTHLRAHETPEHLVCRLLLEKKKKNKKKNKKEEKRMKLKTVT